MKFCDFDYVIKDGNSENDVASLSKIKYDNVKAKCRICFMYRTR